MFLVIIVDRGLEPVRHTTFLGRSAIFTSPARIPSTLPNSTSIKISTQP
jgi:hypothetical protein